MKIKVTIKPDEVKGVWLSIRHSPNALKNYDLPLEEEEIEPIMLACQNYLLEQEGRKKNKLDDPKYWESDEAKMYEKAKSEKWEEYFETFTTRMPQNEKAFWKRFITQALSHQRKELREKVKRMDMITMIPPGKFGDGKPTQIPTSEWGEGYNAALADILELLK